MTRLQKFVDEQSAPAGIHLDRLNIVHSAPGESFVRILESKLLKATACQFFHGEQILYFFVGRPGYKTSIVHNPSYWQLPSVFVFPTLVNTNPARVFPFDTGAFKQGRYKDILGVSDVSEFQISPDYRSVEKLISVFFESLGAYNRGNPKPYREMRDLVGENTRNYVPLALSKLQNFQFNELIDDRARLIELQYTEDVSLRENPPKAIICCEEWKRDAQVISAISSLGCDVEFYPIFPLDTQAYYAKIYELASAFSDE